MGHEMHKLVPEHIEGVEKDLKQDFIAETIEDAEELFVVAKDRLLDVKDWENISSISGAEFRLGDMAGTEVTRPAHAGDDIFIKGYGRLHVEAIEYDDYPDEDYETFAMRLRPGTDLMAGDNNTGEAARSILVIERRGRHVAAHYYGRNGKVDNLNAGAVADIEILGNEGFCGTDPQWLCLIKGLIATGITG